MEQTRSLQKARQVVYRLLKFRPRSAYEISEKLKLKSFPKDVIAETLNYCQEVGLIDDADFAKRWVTYRLLKPFGFNRIRQELKDKGIAKETIEEVLKEAALDVDEESQVKTIVQKKMAAYGKIDKAKIQQRLYSYLLRRGFNPQVVYQVVKNYDR